MRQGEIRIHGEHAACFAEGLFNLSRVIQQFCDICVDDQGEGIKLPCTMNFAECLRGPPHRHQVISVPVVCSRVAGIQIDSALELTLCCHPIPLIMHLHERQRTVCLGQRIVQVQGSQCSFACVEHCLFAWYFTVVHGA